MHNHAPVKHFEGHSFTGRLSEEETSLLVDISKSMVRPKEILVTLKQKDALNVTTMKTIYNVRHKNNVIEKAKRSQMQQLLGELEKHNYIERHKCDNNTMTVTDLFWAHPFSLDLFCSFPKVLIMDCTYKTNRYRLPLLEIVSVTSTNMSFSIAFAYLQFERIDNYVWVLTTLRSLLDDIVILEVIVTNRELALMNAIDRGHPIPFDNINPHRRTLEIVQKLKNDKVELSCEPKFDLILKRFNASDYTMKLEILHKLGEIANPQNTFLIEPNVKPNPQGKGDKKIDVSTRQDPCAFELVQSGHDSHSPMGTQIPTQDSVKVHKKQPAKEKVYRTRTTTTYLCVDALLVGLKLYICLIKDVDADGNCGFRAIVGLMGLAETEKGQVRRDLLQE